MKIKEAFRLSRSASFYYSLTFLNNFRIFNKKYIIKNTGNIMKKLLPIILLLIITATNVNAQLNQSEKSFMSYYDLSDFYHAAPEAFKFGLYGFGNPAITSYLHDSDLLISASSSDPNGLNIDRWGIFSGSSHNGFGALTLYDGDKTITDYRYSIAIGGRSFSLGAGYGFTGGDKGHFNRSNVFTWGGLIRPSRHISLGFHQTVATENSDYESAASLGIRPLAEYPLTFYADYALFGDENLKEGNWSAGISWEVVDGIRLNSRYFESEMLALGLDVSFGNMGVSSLGLTNADQKVSRMNYAIRFGAEDRTIFDFFEEPQFYMQLDLRGSMAYTRPVFFGGDKTFLKTLLKLESAKKNDQIKGVLVNTSGMSINYEMLWEIRQELDELKKQGKEIIIFVDRMGIQGYHFASVADKIIMDPMGTLSLTGYALGRSYYKTMLEKVGVGFQEFRYFKYKSAAESFARDNMSEGDSIQRQAIVDGWMEIAREEITEGRGFSDAEFNEIVNSTFIYHADQALEQGLADTLARWTELKEVMEIIDEEAMVLPKMTEEFVLDTPQPYDDKWGGKKSKIAVIYAEGVCAMDDGIKARTLSKQFKSAAKSSSVAAIVLRVDSPGGDAMASDYIAKLIRKYKDEKPIIVSQGFVAASGGYWLSMDADMIYTSPLTLTGSIGVIGSYFYDAGIQDDMGISTDIVSNGKYAELGYPFTLPFIPIGLPVRKMNEDELDKVEKSIKGLYEKFVNYVADGRDMEYDEVHEIAQGRVWLGKAAVENGLADKTGTLFDAIETAAEKSGVDLDDVEYIEYPERGLFDFSALLGGVFGVELAKETTKLDNLKLRLDNNGLPMPLLPIDYTPYSMGD